PRGEGDLSSGSWSQCASKNLEALREPEKPDHWSPGNGKRLTLFSAFRHLSLLPCPIWNWLRVVVARELEHCKSRYGQLGNGTNHRADYVVIQSVPETSEYPCGGFQVVCARAMAHRRRGASL